MTSGSFSEGATGPVGEEPTQPVVLAQQRGTQLQDRFRAPGPAPVLLLPLHPRVELTDQRGVLHNRDGNGDGVAIVDSGAFER